MTTFASHRSTLESFVDCISGGANTGSLTGFLAEDVRLYGLFGDDPIVGRAIAVETIKTVNGLSSDDTYTDVAAARPTAPPSQRRQPVQSPSISLDAFPGLCRTTKRGLGWRKSIF